MATVGYDIQSAYNSILTAVGNVTDKMAGIFRTEGNDIASALLLVVMSWYVLMWLLTGDGIQSFVMSIAALFKYFFVIALLGGLTTGAVDAVTGELVKKMASLNTTTGGIVGAGLSNLMNTISLIWQKVPSKPYPAITGLVDALVRIIDLFNAYLGSIISFFLRLIASVLLFLAGASFIGILLFAKFQMALAYMVAPLMVPWLIWERTEWLFDSWLKFGLVACFATIVANLMVAVAGAMFAAIRDAAAFINNTSTSTMAATGTQTLDIMVAGTVCVVSAATLYLISKAPQMASDLISGSGRGMVSATGKGVGGSIVSGASKVAAASAGGTAMAAKIAAQVAKELKK